MGKTKKVWAFQEKIIHYFLKAYILSNKFTQIVPLTVKKEYKCQIINHFI